MFRYAIVRPPGENFADGLTTAGLGRPSLDLARAQHEASCAALEACGLELIRLPLDLRHPDSTFVEDIAVLTSHSAVFTRPGAASRIGEVDGVRETVRRFYSVVHEIQATGTLDGGDVCETESHFFIGISDRTNKEGARQLAEFLAADGFTSSSVDIRTSSILHLKSGIAYLGHNTMVAMEELSDREHFAEYELIRVAEHESYACNCVLVNDRVLLPSGFPLVQAELCRRGYVPLMLDMSEFQKMDGGLSCLSLRF